MTCVLIVQAVAKVFRNDDKVVHTGKTRSKNDHASDKFATHDVTVIDISRAMCTWSYC
jgi:hypothetical protein